jgi:hypothetical protein
MEQATFILALDPATRTGWARGAPGERPQSGAVVLRKPSEDLSVACHNIGAFMTDLMRDQMPDLIVFEKPLNPHVWFDMCKKIGRPQNAESLSLQHMIAGVIWREAARRDIRCVEVDRKAVLKHFTGRSSWSSGPGAGDGRALGKKQIIARAKMLGLMPVDSNDDDRADAIANHDWASAVFGRKHASTLALFDEGRLRHA